MDPAQSRGTPTPVEPSFARRRLARLGSDGDRLVFRSHPVVSGSLLIEAPPRYASWMSNHPSLSTMAGLPPTSVASGEPSHTPVVGNLKPWLSGDSQTVTDTRMRRAADIDQPGRERGACNPIFTWAVEEARPTDQPADQRRLQRGSQRPAAPTALRPRVSHRAVARWRRWAVEPRGAGTPPAPSPGSPRAATGPPSSVSALLG
jgi:hypothetical protein